MSIRKPGVAIGLLISMFGIETLLQTQSVFFIDNGRVVNLGVGIVVLLAVVFSIMRHPRRLFKFSRVQLFCFALYIMGFLSYFWTPVPEIFRSRWIGSIPYVGIFLVLAPILAQERGAIRDGLRWTLYFGVPVLLISAFYCEWGRRGMILAAPMMDGERMVEEALPLAVASLASYVGIIGLVVHLKFRASTFMRLAILGVAIYIAFLTRSRGQVVAIVVVSALVYPISNRISSIKGVLVTVFGLSIFAFTIYYIVNSLDLMRWQQDKVEAALLGRQEMWMSLLQSWFETHGLPILTGLGACASFKYVGFYPHNLPIEILVEFGLFGFCIFLVILHQSAYRGVQLLMRLDHDPTVRGEVLVLLGLLALSLVLCLKEGSLYTWPQLFFFAICIGQKLKDAPRESRTKVQLQMRGPYVPGYPPPGHPLRTR